MHRIIIVALVLLFVAGCGGSEFSGQGPGTGGSDAQADTLPDAVDSGTDTDAAKPEASDDALQPDAQDDAAEASTEAGEEASTEAGTEAGPEASIEAAPEATPDVCVPGTCQSLGKDCGPTPDGCGGTISSCGSCPSNQTCGGGGVANKCGGCVPDTCAAHGYTCGKIEDGCGNTLVCGPGTFVPIPSSDINCNSNPGAPHYWYCTSGSSPLPFADCKTTYYPGYFCCPEAS